MRMPRMEEDPAYTGCLPTIPGRNDQEPPEGAGQPLSRYIVGGLFWVLAIAALRLGEECCEMLRWKVLS